ncbi:MAG: hypothetical protein GX676_04480 [Bacilli bacterium]|nr:hypothetical protein [Bacilli bacterium]
MLTKIFYHFYNYKKSALNLISFILLAVVLVVLGLISNFTANSISVIFEVIMYPFKLISDLLRYLSLSGTVGNLISLIIFGLISLLPLILYVYQTLKSKHRVNIVSLVFYLIISILIGVIIYYLINPELITRPLDNFDYLKDILQIYLDYYRKTIQLGLIFITLIIVVLYLTYRFLVKTKQTSLNLFKAAKYLLVIQRLSYTILFIVTFYILPILIKSEVKGIADIQHGKGHMIFLIFIKYAFYYLITYLWFKILRNIHDLLTNYTQEILFEKENVVLFKKCSVLFLINFIANLTYQLIYNAYQLIFKNYIQNISLSFDFPLSSLVLTLVFYLLALWMHQSYEIYTENKLTI